MVERKYEFEKSAGEKCVGEKSAGAELSESVWHVSAEDLLTRIRQVEEAVVRGTAQMSDYETFVRCQEELMRREARHFERDKASNY